MNDNRRYWLWIALALRPGNKRIWELLEQFGSVREAYDALRDGTHPSLSPAEENKIKKTHIEQCDSIIQYCEDKGYYILTFDDEKYPVLLRNIYNPPAVLFCMGDIEIFSRYPAVTCVGTRHPSQYSLDVTKAICTEIAKRDFVIVSGFALGIDSIAHSSAVEAGGRTAAVLACGLDYDYPRENAAYKKFLSEHGVVVTEYFPGTNPTKACFHTRNRIMSGLTFGTVVFEADEMSGSLITANHAAEQGRTVFCVPPADIFDKRYSGVIKYLREGAVPVFSHLDVIYDYFTSNYFRILNGELELPELGAGVNDIHERDSRTVRRMRKTVVRKAAVNPEKTGYNTAEHGKLPEDISDELRKIVKCLDGKELRTDEIAECAGIDTLSILAYLTELEMMGAVELRDGKKYGLTVRL